MSPCPGKCKDCNMGMVDFFRVQRIINISNELINDEAGKIWLKRGGGASSEEQKKADYRNAAETYALDICRRYRKERF